MPLSAKSNTVKPSLSVRH